MSETRAPSEEAVQDPAVSWSSTGVPQWSQLSDGPPGPMAPPPPGPDREPLLSSPAGVAALVAFVVAVLVSGGVVLLAELLDDDDGTVAAPVTTVDAVTLPGLSGSFDLPAVIDAVAPSVVTVRAGRTAGDGTSGSASGAGVVIDDGSRIVTTHRVVSEAGGASVSVVLEDGSELPADVLGSSPSENIAVLALRDGARLTAAPLGTSAAAPVGAAVVGLGDAFVGAGVASASPGVVTSTGRVVSDGDYQLDQLLETNATVSAGSDGGALANSAGQVVGLLTTLAEPSSGVGYAIAIDEVRAVVAQITAGVAPAEAGAPFLGVTVGDIGDMTVEDLDGLDVTVDSGAVVLDLADGSGAAQAGIREGDVIRSVAGVATNSRAEVADVVAGLQPGTSVEVAVLRSSETLLLPVIVGMREAG
ncbi:MAG: trypsin-like peptidase domain-containing protein [Actinomycetota bacterium]